jgi:starch synthase
MAFRHCLRNVAGLFADKPNWTRLQKRGMTQELGWNASSASYATLYESVIREFSSTA